MDPTEDSALTTRQSVKVTKAAAEDHSHDHHHWVTLPKFSWKSPRSVSLSLLECVFLAM